MKPGIIYRGIFANAECNSDNSTNEQMVIVSIYDRDTLIDDAEDPVIIPLEMAAQPVIDAVIDNDEDKFTPIRAKQLEIQIHSGQGIDISTFGGGTDDRWLVELAVNDLTNIIFTGTLSRSDLSQDFMPDPNVITLTAVDGLGALKDIPLVDFDGNNPTGMNKVCDYLAWALSQTGLTLDLSAIMNIRMGNGSRTFNVTFIPSPPPANMILPSTDFFYEGQIITTSSALNPGPFTVTLVGVGAVTLVNLGGTVVSEIDVPDVVFTDITTLGHFYDKVWLDAKTFEDEIGTCINCYDVLLRILGEDCYLTQWRGKWFIMRVDEFDTNDILQGVFNSDGVFQGYEAATTFIKNIGVGSEMQWMNDDAQVSIERPIGTLTEKYKYETPEELICNIDFERGAFIGDIDAQNKKYSIECWLHAFEPFNPITPLLTPDNEAYIQRRITDDQKDEKFVVLTNSVENNYLISQPMYIHIKDKLKMSWQYRWDQDKSGGGILNVPTAFITLRGDNGDNYYLHDDGKWVLSNAVFGTNADSFNITWTPNDLDETIWRTVEVDTQEAPINGLLQISFIAPGSDPSGIDDVYANFQNLQIDYQPYINGSYQRYTGQSITIEQDGSKAKREKDVFISDSPKKIFKGALQVQGGSRLITSGSIQFGVNGFVIPGDVTASYPAGTLLWVNSGSNTGFYRIFSSTYSIIGSQTDVITIEDTTPVTEAARIFRAAFFLASRFYAGNVYTDNDPPEDGVHTFGHLQAYSVWNQYNRTMYKLDGTVDHLGTEDILPDVIHRYQLTDPHPATNNKYFMLLHREQNLNLCEWSGFLHEVYDTVIGKIYSDAKTFKYLTAND